MVSDDLPVLTAHLPQGSLRGLDVVHLQCHIGTDTISLARAGGRMTGVESDVLDARAAVTGDFDVAYTSIGTIGWLGDLERWAPQVAGLLRPGGILFIRDGHPMLYGLDDTAPDLRIRYRYFADGRAQTWDEDTTYVGDGRLTSTRTYEFPHPVSETIGAVLGAGLVLERYDEVRTLPWRFSDRMVEASPERYAWPEDERDLVPCTFTLVARKPAPGAR